MMLRSPFVNRTASAVRAAFETLAMRPRVLIINTGGTIGMGRTAEGYQPQAGFLRQQMQRIPELSDPQMPEYEIREFDPVIDSANMTPADWLRIAEQIAEARDRFQGFLVLHGTDTMAYTASALAFLLRGLGKTVVLTGSQLPLCELRSDARENVLTAMIIASRYAVPEVTILFGSRLLRGCRATKQSTSRFDAFDSPNYPPLAIAGTEIEIHYDRMLAPPRDEAFRLIPFAPTEIATLRLFPGLSPRIVRRLLEPPVQAVVLQSYGVGNGPSREAEFLEALREASDRHVLIVNLSQCPQGEVAMAEYATGDALLNAGVISGGDMTFEAAIAKLNYLLARPLSYDERRTAIRQNLVGELTPPESPEP